MMRRKIEHLNLKYPLLFAFKSLINNSRLSFFFQKQTNV